MTVVVKKGGGVYRYSKKSDVWSFGMLCYEILVRKIPYAGRTVRTVAHLVLSGKKPVIPDDHRC